MVFLIVLRYRIDIIEKKKNLLRYSESSIKVIHSLKKGEKEAGMKFYIHVWLRLLLESTIPSCTLLHLGSFIILEWTNAS